MFICNHCPYVKAIIKDLVEDVKFLENWNDEMIESYFEDLNNLSLLLFSLLSSKIT